MASTKDDSADSVQFFEGVEKLLEIWFTSNSARNKQLGDLRQIPRLNQGSYIWCQKVLPVHVFTFGCSKLDGQLVRYPILKGFLCTMNIMNLIRFLTPHYSFLGTTAGSFLSYFPSFF
ncbi:hypothetical protein KPH14_012233 [Odynerus spinipes]|uniref:Uncharacterized protein n=1 Tax=Odynerus spinipes TaxID=1348599 RepID=A0AAD9VL46_9HYME|nr:hypothetical protein KPH14_012233 [Odynerus spinipes]